MRVSPSQYKMAEDRESGCNRKWWLRYVHKCEEPKRSWHHFGTTLHSVGERYFLADHAGRDKKTGEIVELYPPGWDRNITPPEAKQIQRLVPKAIEKGVWFRPPEVLIEHQYFWEIPGTGVTETGVIDWATPDEIRDHKTPRSRRWATSVEDLHVDHQMLTYARWLRRQRAVAGEPDTDIQVGHNIFVKGHTAEDVARASLNGKRLEIEDVFFRPTVLERAELDAHDETVVKIVNSMLDISQVPESQWKKVPGPPEGRNSCEAYGGCAFRGICSGGETPSMYRNRMARVAAAVSGGSSKVMGILDSIKNKGSAAVHVGTAETNKATVVIPPAPNVVTVVTTGSSTPSAAAQAARAAIAAAHAAARPAGPPPPAVPHDQPVQINPGPPAAAAPATTSAATAAAPSNPGNSVGGPEVGAVLNPGARIAPWAANGQGCTSCRGNPVPGFSSTSGPCRVCDSFARRDGRPSSLSYNARLVDGVPTWDELAPPVAEPPRALEALSVAQQARSMQIDEAVGVSEEEAAALAAVLAEGELAAEPAPAAGEPPKRKRGRPPGTPNKPKTPGDGSSPAPAAERAPHEQPGSPDLPPKANGARIAVPPESRLTRPHAPPIVHIQTTSAPAGVFCIAIGCHPKYPPVAAPRTHIGLEWLFKQARARARTESGKDFFELNTWERRDALRLLAEDLAAELIPGGAWVLAPVRPEPDEAALLAGLLPLAQLVVTA